MATEGEPPQGGHELDFGSGSQDPAPPPAAPGPPPAVPGVPPAVPGVPPAVPGVPPLAGAAPSVTDPAQGGHELAFGTGSAAPAAGAPVLSGDQAPPVPPYARPSGPASAAYPGPPYGAHPGDTSGAQPLQAYRGPSYGAQPTQAYPAGPYSGPPPKKSSKGLLWGLIGGGAVVLIAAVLIVALLVVPAVTRSSVTAADTVKAYLTAVSQSDAKSALGYLEGVPNKELLTDAVLKESNKLAPIGHISVKKDAEGKYSASVPVTFSIGDRTVSTTYDVYRLKDAWKITNGVIPFSVDGIRGLDATVNGVSSANLTSPYVFPGAYAIALDSKYFSIDGDSTFTVGSPDDASALYDVKTKLNDAGVSQFRSLVRAAVEACVAMKTLSTPCGMDITAIDLSGATPVDGSVTRTLTAEGSAALDTLKPESSGSSPTVVSTYDSISVDTTLQGSDGNTYTVTFGGYLDTPKVDFGVATPTVVWE
ncbi:MAG: hypothetical protein JST33_07860 [Actinobacteria bacterium]|nr:hypothetical protein [Actinomycetota bacterium]